MSTKYKWLLGIGVLIAVIAIIYYIKKRPQATASEKGTIIKGVATPEQIAVIGKGVVAPKILKDVPKDITNPTEGLQIIVDGTTYTYTKGSFIA